MRKLRNCIADILKKFKQLKFDQKLPDIYGNEPVIVKNYAFGQPSGAQDLAKYEKWIFVNDERINERK